MKKIILLFGLILILTGCSFANNDSKDNALNKKNEENNSNPSSLEEKIKEKLCNIYISKKSSKRYIVFPEVFKCGEYYAVKAIVEDVGSSIYDKFGERVATCPSGFMELSPDDKIAKECDIKCINEDICAPKRELYDKALETDDLNLCLTLIKDEDRCKEELKLYQEQSKKLP